MTSREQVLALLEKNRERYVSGEKIAEQLGLTRSAVWKAISALRSDGYQIEAVTRRGYCLSGEQTVLSRAGMEPYLRREIDPERIQIYETLPSSSRTAKEQAVNGAPHGTVILAEQQTEGAARGAGTFASPPGGLYMSVILRPGQGEVPGHAGWARLSAGDYPRAAAACVCRAIRQVCLLDVTIRGLDDLFLEDRKVCGILTECGSEVETGDVQWVVAGIGIRFQKPPGEEAGPDAREEGWLFEREPSVSRNRLAAEIINLLLCGDPAEHLKDYTNRRVD